MAGTWGRDAAGQAHSDRTEALQQAVEAAEREASAATAAAATAAATAAAQAARAAELQTCCERQQSHLQVRSQTPVQTFSLE